MILNCELKREWMEAVVAYFKVLSRLPGENEGSYGKPVLYIVDLGTLLEPIFKCVLIYLRELYKAR
jgi:hypothetical protein